MCVVCCWQWWVEWRLWRLCVVQFRWSGAPCMGRYFTTFFTTFHLDTVPHMRKINRNSTFLQVQGTRRCVHTLNIIYSNFK
jgi:hypothetical protein